MAISSVWSTITSKIPLIKVSKWDVMAKVDDVKKEQSDSSIFGSIKSFINSSRDFVDNIQTAVSNIFQGNQSDGYKTIASFDSFISFNGVHETQVVQNAIENGSFRSVNKIQKPNTCVIELAKGGYRSAIQEVLDNLKYYQQSLALCKIITPFGILSNMNITKLEYSFNENNGSNLLVAKLTLQEVRFGKVRESKFSISNVANPSSSDTVNTGRKSLMSTIADLGNF